jgi:MmgE/PrpD C-terminal domain
MPPGGMWVLIYPHPKTGLEGTLSLQYALAAGVIDGQYTLWSFTDGAVNRPEIRDLLARIWVGEDLCCVGGDPLIETRSSGSSGFVEVEAVLTDGRFLDPSSCPLESTRSKSLRLPRHLQRLRKTAS